MPIIKCPKCGEKYSSLLALHNCQKTKEPKERKSEDIKEVKEQRWFMGGIGRILRIVFVLIVIVLILKLIYKFLVAIHPAELFTIVLVGGCFAYLYYHYKKGNLPDL